MNPASEWEPERRGNRVIAAFINVIYQEGKSPAVVAHHTLSSLHTDLTKLSHSAISLYEPQRRIMGDKAEMPLSKHPCHIT